MRAPLIMLLVLTAAVVARAGLEFSGYFITPQQALFSLTETESRRSSGWLKVGQAFAGHVVVAFDPEHDTLTVERDGRRQKLPLREAKIKDGRATISGTIKFMHEKIEGMRATLFVGEETVLPLREGVSFHLKPVPQPDGTILYDAKFVSRENDGKERVLAAPRVLALAGQPFGIQIGELGYSFTP